MLRDTRNKINDLLEAITSELDIPDKMYDIAVAHYNSVGEWLSGEGSFFFNKNGRIFPQGSFMLGTMIRPYDSSQDYDIDLVFCSDLKKQDVTQYMLKNKVGERLKNHETYRRLIQPEKKRCWTLKYSDNERFHLDILPAVYDEDFKRVLIEKFALSRDLSDDALAITDTTDPNYYQMSTDWPSSNPLGFGKWFLSKMEEQTILLKEAWDIAEVPSYKRKTTLQRVVQILKRHRDMMFGNDDNKPASIIITTLAALSYNNESKIIAALNKAVLEIYLKPDDFILPNPVNEQEVFTDKWLKEPEKRVAFNKWKAQLYADMNAIIGDDQTLLEDRMYGMFGEVIVKEAARIVNSKKPLPKTPLYDIPQVQINTPPRPYGIN